MVVDKGLPGDVADRIGEFVVLAGEPLALLATLQSEGHALAVHAGSRAALEEMGLLFGYLGTMGALGALRFDLSLARGLDYYTGVIYEAVLTGGGNVGSIAAGGRYDGLVGMFSGKDIPAVGVSIGIERVFAIMEQRLRAQAAERGGLIRETQTQVLVASIGNGMQAQRMRVCSQLWAAGVKAEFGYKANPKMGDQLGHALKGGIPLMVLFGQDEVDSGALKVRASLCCCRCCRSCACWQIVCSCHGLSMREPASACCARAPACACRDVPAAVRVSCPPCCSPMRTHTPLPSESQLKNLQRETEELVPEADIVQAVRAALLTVDDGPMASGAAGSAKACDGRQ